MRFHTIRQGQEVKVLAFLTLLLAGGCGPQNTFSPPPAPSVGVIEVRPTTAEVYEEVTGRIDATETVEIRARVSGLLQEIKFSPGQLVKEGDPLFTIEPELYQAAVQSAEGSLERTKASAQLADATYQIQEQLFQKGTVSQIEFLQASARRNEAIAHVKEAEGMLQKAELDLSYTSITSPINGRIGRNLVSEGNLIGSGENTLLATVVSDNPVYAYFTVDQRTMLGLLRSEDDRPGDGPGKGQEFYLRLADGHDYSEKGKLDYVDNQVSSESGTLELRALFPNPEGQLIPGIFARVRVRQVLEDVITVPTRAIQRNLAGSYVTVIEQNNLANIRGITTGPLDGDQTIVVEGLIAGDRVAVDGIQRVRPGQEVIVQEIPKQPILGTLSESEERE